MVGLNSRLAARKLVRLLLADPLGDEAGWEKKLVESCGDGDKVVLLRYVFMCFGIMVKCV